MHLRNRGIIMAHRNGAFRHELAVCLMQQRFQVHSGHLRPADSTETMLRYLHEANSGDVLFCGDELLGNNTHPVLRQIRLKIDTGVFKAVTVIALFRQAGSHYRIDSDNAIREGLLKAGATFCLPYPRHHSHFTWGDFVMHLADFRETPLPTQR